MNANENHGLSSCRGSVYCTDCGGVCSQDLLGDAEPDHFDPNGGPTRLVPCPSLVHQSEPGALLESCSICAPFWGEVEVPIRFGTYRSYLEWRDQEARIEARRRGAR